MCRQHHQSSGATLPRGKPQWHQTKKDTEWKAHFKTHTQQNRLRPAAVNHTDTKELWRFFYLLFFKRNVWVITNKHINNYGIFQSSNYTRGIVLGNSMVIINMLYHIITVRKLSLFWITIKMLPCCNCCYCVTSLCAKCRTLNGGNTEAGLDFKGGKKVYIHIWYFMQAFPLLHVELPCFDLLLPQSGW